MSGVWLPAATAIAAIAATYFCCLRPMRRGHCAVTGSGKQQRAAGTLDRALADARAELATLKANTADHPAPEGHHATRAAHASNVASRRLKP